MATTSPIGRSALVGAIESVGLAEFARRLNVKYQLVQGWLDENRRFATPAEYCPEIEREFGIRCEVMRPDIDWAVLRRPAEERGA